MNEGGVVLVPLPQYDGRLKPRPAILLRRTPPFDDWLICGISSQIHQKVVGFDEIIEPGDLDFIGSGLKMASVIRLGFLTTTPSERFLGIPGSISRERHELLLGKLSRFLAIKRDTKEDD